MQDYLREVYFLKKSSVWAAFVEVRLGGFFNKKVKVAPKLLFKFVSALPMQIWHLQRGSAEKG